MKSALLIAGLAALTLAGCASYGPPPDGGVVVDPYPCDHSRDPFCTYPAPPPVIVVDPGHDHPRPPVDPGHGGHGGWGGGGDHPRPPVNPGPRPGPVGPGGSGRRDVPAKADKPVESGKAAQETETHPKN